MFLLSFFRGLGQVQTSDVILTSIENNAAGGIDLIMYVQLPDSNMVLSQQALLRAVEVKVIPIHVLHKQGEAIQLLNTAKFSATIILITSSLYSRIELYARFGLTYHYYYDCSPTLRVM